MSVVFHEQVNLLNRVVAYKKYISKLQSGLHFSWSYSLIDVQQGALAKHGSKAFILKPWITMDDDIKSFHIFKPWTMIDKKQCAHGITAAMQSNSTVTNDLLSTNVRQLVLNTLQ